MAVKPYNQDDEDNPYAQAGTGSESSAVDPNQPPEPPQSRAATPSADAPIAERPQPSQPTPYVPPPTVAAPPSSTGDAPPVRTFAQMEAEGQARPPAPASTASITELLGGATDTGVGQLPPSPMVSSIDASQPSVTDTGGGEWQPSPMVPPPLEMGATDTGTGEPPPSPMATGANAPVVSPPKLPSSVDSILPLLTGKATGNGKSPLEQATEAKALAQLNGASPYDSEEVKNEYNWLSGNIDDQFANDVRSTDNGFAQRGLYGSAGKDFHSGRLSDLNVGKRSAKETLGRDLAEKYATTKGQYDANAITQGQNVANAGNANQLDWLHSLMGYGNDAYNHDLQSAEFQQRQNESEQDYLLRLLEAGYGA